MSWIPVPVFLNSHTEVPLSAGSTLPRWRTSPQVSCLGILALQLSLICCDSLENSFESVL